MWPGSDSSDESEDTLESTQIKTIFKQKKQIQTNEEPAPVVNCNCQCKCKLEVEPPV